MKQRKFIRVPKQWLMLDKFDSEYGIYSRRNLFLNQYAVINKLLKITYSFYYIFNYNIYNFFRKLVYLNFLRFYFKPLYYIHIVQSVYKSYAQIYLKEYNFYKSFDNNSYTSKVLPVYKKTFKLTPYIYSLTKSYLSSLPGGSNNFLWKISKEKTFKVSDFDLFFKDFLVHKKVLNLTSQSQFFLLNNVLTLIFCLTLHHFLIFYQLITHNILFRL